MTPLDLAAIVCLLFGAGYAIASVGLACSAVIDWIKRKRANSPDSREVTMADAVEVLRELVRLKDLHDRIECIAFDTMDEYRAAVTEYNQKKPKAWASARIVIASPSTTSAQK